MPGLRPPTGLSNLRRFIVIAATGPLATAVVPLLAAGPAAAQSNLLANPGFETGTTAGWSCSPLDSVVTSSVHSGTYALAGAGVRLR